MSVAKSSTSSSPQLCCTLAFPTSSMAMRRPAPMIQEAIVHVRKVRKLHRIFPREEKLAAQKAKEENKATEAVQKIEEERLAAQKAEEQVVEAIPMI